MRAGPEKGGGSGLPASRPAAESLQRDATVRAPTSYDFKTIEAKWQERWRAEGSFEAPAHPEGETFFVLVYPPYPNGRIHMGHVRNYTIGDAVARFERLRGKSVLHPIGFDAFGLPNEIEAARQGALPEALTRSNIATMTRQLKRLGYSYDWSRALITIDPDYYKWNQWLFLALYEQGLVYRKGARVQWCPDCRTSLANEQVQEGSCWRCGTQVVARHLSQWFFRLRAYAEEIWAEARQGAYPENIAAMLCAWLGRSEGATLRFQVLDAAEVVTTFTTKPELAWGATYIALSPEHPQAQRLAERGGVVAAARDLIEKVRESAEPADLTDGLDTGVRAVHPLTGETIPIWLAAYVDPEFGTGAVMGNPCHDRRDDLFGRVHGLPGRPVASPDGSRWDYGARGPYLEDGVLSGGSAFAGRGALEARGAVIADWETRGVGGAETLFAVRDWLVSRQRAWGTPIPMVHCAECAEAPVDRAGLPVRLPPGLRDAGEGNPLDHRADFVACPCPRCGMPARRETDTMDTFIDTAWYYLRCTNPAYREGPFDPEGIARWAPADLYVGGIEISVPIMLYGSFIAKGLRDAGHIGFGRPCRRLLAHDMVLNRGRKMSKSLGNTVDPEELAEQVGADSVRLLILSLAPPLKKIEWSESRLLGCHRLLQRIWNLGVRWAARDSGGPGSGIEPGVGAAIGSAVSPEEGSAAGRAVGPVAGSAARSVSKSGRGSGFESNATPVEEALKRATEETVRTVTRDMERLQPNTCITELTKFVYALEELEGLATGSGESPARAAAAFCEAFRTLLILLSPFTPHLCEELWERIGQPGSLRTARWPGIDREARALVASRITVKVNARPVVRLEVPAEATAEQVSEMAMQNDAVNERIGRGHVKKVVYVPGQILNFVVSP